MKQRPPVRTIIELAQEFDATAHYLGAIIRHDSATPKPVFEKGTYSRGIGGRLNKVTRSIYPLAEMRVWWAARQAKGVASA